MKSIIYWHPRLYRLSMSLLYGGLMNAHYRLLAQEIGKMKVLDLCFADAYLSRFVESDKYTGIDINPVFVSRAKKNNLRVWLGDISAMDLPQEECIVLVSSLYQFYPLHDRLIEKILNAATKKFILSETVSHLADSANAVVAGLAKNFTQINDRKNSKRFNREELTQILKRHRVNRLISTGKDLVGIFEKTNKT